MTREHFLGTLLGLVMTPLAGCSEPNGPYDREPDERPELYKTREQWRALLPQAAFSVLFLEQTETPGSSPLDKEDREGTYVCAACYIPLFSSETKYETGTGWPSFWQPIEGRLGFRLEPDLRTEYHCKRCGGHQGHVFDDGPPPTGKRHCNNGLALQFVPNGQALPALRT
jgi:peptide-methionine (R)-S-oxide reductase